MKFRYDTSGTWFKGNTHIHSTASDGGKTFAEIAELYASAGYEFLFRTDHWVASDVAADTEDYPLLWLDGIELDGQDLTGAMYHVVCLGRVRDIEREHGLPAGVASAQDQGGLLILAHPHWSGNSLDDVLRLPFRGVEIYNNVCRMLNGKSGGMVHWDTALRDNPNTLAFAVDDAHLKTAEPQWNGGWIVVNAKSCSRDTIMAAIRRGNFYSSCGPAFESIELAGRDLSLSTSPIRSARLAGPGPRGITVEARDAETLARVTMSLPEKWDYCYAEIEDEAGKRAWTNNLLVGE
ncbi:MAG: hypothetical protein QGH42_10415 [Kiritimatiellia bacterium]|jgi:hypothetical protein|nr:hypothetical protein [Kiritimatiellia bacterium]MDP6630624.1 hypothetical protein [Kiritimatiellia bacterium]MDP6811329.1 hypothetical protein [Kiritimatiellia bacterium]MDP7024635.1 hypothetical protein [Kiritimatiellia bacterium]